MKKVAAVTFGCKVNQYETACILDDFKNAGYEISDFNKPADIYIINSCTVTNRTDYKSRNAIRKALDFKKNNSDVKVIVTGCYVQRNADKVRELGPVDLVIDNNNKGKILTSLQTETEQFNDIFSAEKFTELSTSNVLDRSRAFVKIQDGCNYFCSYCAVPYGRGNPRSREPENVIDQVEKLVRSGYKEVVLGGINLGLYGLEKKNGYYLAQLLEDLESLSGLEIIRLSSIEPQLFTEDLLNFFSRSKKLAPHFHIPLQSGSDEILKSMNRKYSVTQFQILLDNILSILPSAAIGLDVITGLPGESEKHFNKTYELLHVLPYTYLHVFSYSVRLGTKAASMDGQIKGDVIKKRNKILTVLSDTKKRIYKENLLSKKILVRGIAEKEVKKYWTALSDHYIRIYFKGNDIAEKSLVQGIADRVFWDGVEIKIK